MQDQRELRSVLETQVSEAGALRDRLVQAQRECAYLEQHLRDFESELLVAAQATATATERLGAHVVRHGLVLAAGVERWGAERAAAEDELQRMERLLFERDQEIARLRRSARQLEASRLQGDLELRGLAVANEVATAEVRALGAGISELRSRHGAGANMALKGPSTNMLALVEDADRRLQSKRAEHAALRIRAEAIAEEARQLEAEDASSAQLVIDFDRALRAKRKQLELDDQRFTREGELLREQGKELRRTLEREQRDAVGVGQRAALQQHTAAEAESVKREVAEILAAMPKLASRLYTGGRHVYSLMVPGDIVDERLHDYLRGCGPRGDPTPALVCRLNQKDYVIDGTRVFLTEAQGQIMVQEANGAAAHLRDFLRRRLPPPPTAPPRPAAPPRQAPPSMAPGRAGGMVAQAQPPPPPSVLGEAIVF